MIPCQRKLFNIPEDVAYFNCAYFAPQMHKVREAGYLGVSRKDHPWKIGPEHFFNESELARGLFAALIEASPDDIAILPSVSYGIGVASALVEIKAGDEIVVLEDQFPSNVYSWLELARTKQGRIRTVKKPADFDWSKGVLETINERTAVVALPNVHWTDGSLVDLEKVGEACRKSGAALVLDVTQSLGALPFSVKQVRPDFLVSAAYKWLLGPYSMAFMYVNPEYQHKRPLENNWLNRKNSEDFAGLVLYRDEFQPGARRFDVGERSNFALMPMAVAALQQITEWTVSEIQQTLSVMTESLAEQAAELDLSVIPHAKRGGHILGVRFPKGLPEGILQRLAEENVYVSLRGNAMRIAPHVYNDDRDLEKLVDVLAKSLSRQNKKMISGYS